MIVDSINSSMSLSSVPPEKKSQTEETKKTETEKKVKNQGDSLMLSSQALNMNPIQAKLNSGAYDKPEVLNDVAKKLNQLYPPA